MIIATWLFALASLAPAAPRTDATRLPGLDAAANASVAEAPRASASGVYPVYELPEGWLLFDRGAAGASRAGRALAARARVLVVGSRGAGLFSIARTTRVQAACVRGKPGKVLAYVLRAGPREAIGTPIMGLRAPGGRALDVGRARVYRLSNEVDDETYKGLAPALKRAILSDVQGGAFRFKDDDSLGLHFAQEPDPDKIQLKIDFGSKLRLRGVSDAFVLVEDAAISRSSRRCLRLFSGARALGGCSAMPDGLMAETQSLGFVAYDPNGRGQPFLLAYTTREPLWGHERWGYRLTRAGPKRFLMDALDPKCRERF